MQRNSIRIPEDHHHPIGIPAGKNDNMSENSAFQEGRNTGFLHCNDFRPENNLYTHLHPRLLDEQRCRTSAVGIVVGLGCR